MKDDYVFQAVLTTRGRKTGKEHSVWLRAVMHEGKVYFSRHKPDADWFQNAIKNSNVKVQLKDTIHFGKAAQVTDKVLAAKISELKYPGEERAKEKRVTIVVTLCEQL